MTNKKQQRLSIEEANKIAGAWARLEDLRTGIATPELVVPEGSRTPDTQTLTRDAEIEALIEYLSGAFLTHASDLLGAFFVVQTEYAPLCRALAPLVKRCNVAQTVAAPIGESVIKENADNE